MMPPGGRKCQFWRMVVLGDVAVGAEQGDGGLMT